jgi:hypothetical protein
MGSFMTGSNDWASAHAAMADRVGDCWLYPLLLTMKTVGAGTAVGESKITFLRCSYLVDAAACNSAQIGRSVPPFIRGK